MGLQLLVDNTSSVLKLISVSHHYKYTLVYIVKCMSVFKQLVCICPLQSLALSLKGKSFLPVTMGNNKICSVYQFLVAEGECFPEGIPCSHSTLLWFYLSSFATVTRRWKARFKSSVCYYCPLRDFIFLYCYFCVHPFCLLTRLPFADVVSLSQDSVPDVWRMNTCCKQSVKPILLTTICML